GCAGRPQQQGMRAVRGDVVLREEVRIPRSDHPVGDEEAGVAMVGMEAVTLPRVVAEHDRGTGPADPPGHPLSLLDAGHELAVDSAQEVDLAGAAAAYDHRRGPLLLLANSDELVDGLARVPRALRPVGQDEVNHLAA